VVLAWALWLLTFGCCAAGLLVTLAVCRPLGVGVLVEGAWYAFFFVLGFATVGLVLALRRPVNPIGWLYGARRPHLGLQPPDVALDRPARPRAPAPWPAP
jgi:hypothetical protein